MGRPVRVVKEFTFDCAHLLTGHQGLCANLHGHTYKLQVELEGQLIDAGPSKGMVIDFSDLKALVKERIVDVFDHAFIYWGKAAEDTAERKLAMVACECGMRTVALFERPTAEYMSQLFFQTIEQELHNSNIRVTAIRLWETPTSYAEYRG